jgi:hypothetical protein
MFKTLMRWLVASVIVGFAWPSFCTTGADRRCDAGFAA